MKILGKTVLVLAALSLLVLAGAAGAEETINGTVKSIDLAAKTIVIKSFFGPEVAVTISDEDAATLNKFRMKLIKVDDSVRVKYVTREGRNVATFFRKTAGC